MKNKILFLAIIVISLTTYAQSDWQNYISSGHVDVVTVMGDDVFFGGTGSGLIKYNVETNTTTYFNKANSGIGSNVVKAIATDGDGNIWVGSSYCTDSYFSGGLYHFDGTSWEILTKENSGLPGNSIRALAIAENGDLWVGDFAGGIGVYDGTSWVYHNHNNSVVPPDIADIEFAKNGDVWAAGYSKGVVKFDGENWVKFDESNSGLPSNSVRDIDIDENGTIWIGTINGGGLTSFDTAGNWITYNEENSDISKDLVYSVLCTDDEVWVGTSGGGVNCFKDGNWEVFTPDNSGLLSEYIGVVNKDNNGTIWAGSYGSGLASYDGTDWVSHFEEFGNLQHSNVNNISAGQDDKVWIATTGGLAIKDGTSWQYLGHHNSILNPSYVSAVAADLNGNGWIGDARDGLFFYDGVELVDYTETNHELLYDNFIQVLKVRENELWLGTFGDGIGVFDGDIWTNYNRDNSEIISDKVYSFTFDQDGSVWMGTTNGLCVLYEDDSWEFWNYTNSGLPKTTVHGVVIDTDNNKWLGTTDGLILFDGTDFTIFDHDNSELPNDIVLSLCIDSNDKVWMGTKLGMAAFDGSAWEIFDNNNTGLSGSYIKTLVIDEYGNKWIGAKNNGVAVYNENGLVGKNEKLLNNNSLIMLDVYPNPGNNYTTIKYSLPKKAKVEISLLDQSGRLISKFNEGNKSKGEHELRINIEDYPSGVYFYKLSTPELHTTKMLIIN